MVTISSRDGGPVDEDGYQWPKGVGRPAIAALRQAGITTLEALAGRSEREIASLHGMGPKSLRILKEVMAQRGIQPLS
jgi:predicted flap endonuclease-1-like 5' DNA nuclease